MDEDSVFVVFSIVNECDDILINCPNGLFGAKVNNVLMLLGNCYLLNYNALKQFRQMLILAHLLHLYLDQHLFMYSLITPSFLKIIICILLLL